VSALPGRISFHRLEDVRNKEEGKRATVSLGKAMELNGEKDLNLVHFAAYTGFDSAVESLPILQSLPSARSKTPLQIIVDGGMVGQYPKSHHFMRESLELLEEKFSPVSVDLNYERLQEKTSYFLALTFISEMCSQ